MPPKKLTNNAGENFRRQAKKDKFTTEKNQETDRTNIIIDNKVIRLSKHDIKIVLANEVVRAQLPLIRPFAEEQHGEGLLDKYNKETGKIVRKKLELNRKQVVNNAPNSVLSYKPVVKKGKPRIIPMKLRDSVMTVPTCNATEMVNEIHIEQIKKQQVRKVRKKEAVETEVCAANKKTVEENIQPAKLKTIRNRNISINRKTIYSGPRTRRKSTLSKIDKPIIEITLNNISDTPQETNELADNSSKEIIAESNNDLVNNSSKVYETTNENNVEIRRCSFASELSWTKDISSSSSITCVTVSSKDFVRIDKKLPIVKLKNINYELNSEENNINIVNKTSETVIVREMVSNLCEGSKTSCDKLNDKNTNEIDFGDTQLDLSSTSTNSSSETEKSIKTVPEAINKLSNTLQKLSSKLKKIDLEIINWIGYTNDTNHNIEKIQNKLFHGHFLKGEMNVMLHCQNIKHTLSVPQNTETVETRHSDDNKNIDSEEIFHNTSLDNSHDPKRYTDDNIFLEPINDIKPNHHNKELSIVNKSVLNHSSHNNTYDEDDDALSLFAESITGIESSTKNSIGQENNSIKFDEYIPEPVVNQPVTITYEPTKILGNEKLQDTENENQANNVCEKQNADSTSIYRDSEVNENDVICEDRFGDFDKAQQESTKSIPKRPLFLNSTQKSFISYKSDIFKRICYFNVVSSCKRPNTCKFSHVLLGVKDMKNELALLNDETVINEYILIRSVSKLKHEYGICFLDECIKRNLSRIAVEIALDFAINIKFNPDPVTLEIIETALLHLNSVDLSVCDDLLKYRIKSNGVLLCDCFMSTIAISQNFFRFKSVFMKLTDFMFRMGRDFNSDVALHILERVVILPYDEGLAQALMKIIRNTKVIIFSSSMIGHLEQQLLSSNIEIYEEFRSLKEQGLKCQQVLGNCYNDSPLFNNDVNKSNCHLEKNIRYSPDTTNLDTLTTEPIFTRTNGINKLKFLHINGQLNSNSSESDERKNQQISWLSRARNINPNDTMSNTELMRPPLRRPFKRRSDLSFGGSPNKFQRRKGHSFF